MAESSAILHEAEAVLGPELIDRHRAIVSIMEELEAVDWYDQRTRACTDPELAAILAHNRDEEKEHAAMTLEWLRRRDPKLDEQLRTYLFTTGPLLAVEAAAAAGEGGEAGPGAAGGPGAASGAAASLGIGSLRALRDGGSL